MTEKPHIQTILGTALVSSFAYIIGLLSLDGDSSVFTANLDFGIVVAIICLALSVIFLIYSAKSVTQIGSRLENFAIWTFLSGFSLLIVLTISWVTQDFTGFFSFHFPDIFISLAIGFLFGFFLKAKTFKK